MNVYRPWKLKLIQVHQSQCFQFMYSAGKKVKLTEPTKIILELNSTLLDVMNTFRACLKNDKKCIQQDVKVLPVKAS